MERRGRKPGPSKTNIADKPKTGKVAPQHVRDRQRERVKDRFTNMGTPEETYESKGGKVLKTGKHRGILAMCAASSTGSSSVRSRAIEWKGGPGAWGRGREGRRGAWLARTALTPGSALSASHVILSNVIKRRCPIERQPPPMAEPLQELAVGWTYVQTKWGVACQWAEPPEPG